MHPALKWQPPTSPRLSGCICNWHGSRRLMFLYLSWQDVVSFRVASVASITSNPSVVELSVDDPLSPIFEEETPDIATSVLQSDFPSGDGCSVAAVLPPVATVQTNFQQRKEEGGKSERTDRSEFLGEDEWFWGREGWSNDLTMEEEMEEIIWCELCWVNLMVKRCWWFIRLSFGGKRKKRRKYLSQKLFVGDRIPLLKIKKYNLETELEHCKSIDTTNSRKLFLTSLEIGIILIKMWVIARFIRDSARNYDSIEISFYLHEMKMYNRIKNGVKVRGVNEGDGGRKKMFSHSAL